MDKALFLLSFSMERGVENLEPRGEKRAVRTGGLALMTPNPLEAFFCAHLNLTVGNDILPSPEPI